MMIGIGCGNTAQDRKNMDNEESYEINDESYNPDMKEAEDFAKEAVSGSMMEVQMADIAINRSENTEIDQLAQAIKMDHQSAWNELKSMAMDKNWMLPVTLTGKHQQKVDKLQNTGTEKFDEEYLELVVSTHENAIDEFEKCANKNHDPELTAWVYNTLPLLHQHRAESKALLTRTASR
jgi:putative membrane protein